MKLGSACFMVLAFSNMNIIQITQWMYCSLEAIYITRSQMLPRGMFNNILQRRCSKHIPLWYTWTKSKPIFKMWLTMFFLSFSQEYLNIFDEFVDFCVCVLGGAVCVCECPKEWQGVLHSLYFGSNMWTVSFLIDSDSDITVEVICLCYLTIWVRKLW